MNSDATPQRRVGQAAGVATPRPRGMRGWVKALIALIGLLVVLAVIDRVAEYVTARKLAERIQAAQHLSVRPHVSIGGWPFLTQVVAGQYRSVIITSSAPVGQDGIAVDNADVHLRGVQVSTSDAVHGTVADVPVASGNGTALLT